MIVVEHIHEYVDKIPSEKEKLIGDIDDFLRQTGWSQHGKIKFKDVKMRYQQYSPIILKKPCINFSTGTRIGVIGRTGQSRGFFWVFCFE